MPDDIQYDTYQHFGTHAQRLAFTPSPPAIVGCQPLYRWFETDTLTYWTYHTAWLQEATGGGGGAITDMFMLMGG